MESTQAHLEKLGAAYERLMSSLIDSKGVNNLIDSLTTVVNLLSNFSESVGGSRGLLLTLGSIGTQVFSNQIGASLNTVINNLINTRQQMINVQQEMQKIGEYKASDAVMSDPIMKKIIQMRERLEQNKPFMSEEDINKAKELIDTVEKEYDKIDLKRMEYWETLREAASMDPNK